MRGAIAGACLVVLAGCSTQPWTDYEEVRSLKTKVLLPNGDRGGTVRCRELRVTSSESRRARTGLSVAATGEPLTPGGERGILEATVRAGGHPFVGIGSFNFSRRNSERVVLKSWAYGDGWNTPIMRVAPGGFEDTLWILPRISSCEVRLLPMQERTRTVRIAPREDT
jgi:hypothetical protein